MKNSTAQVAIENYLLKRTDRLEMPEVVSRQRDWQVSFLELSIPLEKKPNLAFKRSFDLVLSSLLIVFLFSWLLPILALLIKLDSKGPVFFTQKRNKKGGRLFTCIKFRTMIVNDEADLLPAHENDRRITRLGRFLRHHHLDELPQLLNVWWGDMSVIGPRPHMLSDNEKYEALLDFYAYRHRIKPGITGLAQVLGYVGSVTDPENMKERVQKDIYYIHNWSAALDMKIIYRTFFKMAGIKQQPSGKTSVKVR
jgi:putative colanic acid biosynthesis UDP-glucose lipid carrier transferase